MILTVTENGFGKATHFKNYRLQNRGGKGVKNISVTAKIGQVVSVLKISENDMNDKDLLFITQEGIVMKTEVSNIKVSGRATQGVTLMRLNATDKVANVEIMEKTENIS
jgi:DNA gyrase subunit A